MGIQSAVSIPIKLLFNDVKIPSAFPSLSAFVFLVKVIILLL